MLRLFFSIRRTYGKFLRATFLRSKCHPCGGVIASIRLIPIDFTYSSLEFCASEMKSFTMSSLSTPREIGTSIHTHVTKCIRSTPIIKMRTHTLAHTASLERYVYSFLARMSLPILLAASPLPHVSSVAQ